MSFLEKTYPPAVIINKGAVYENLLFPDIYRARNFIKFKYSNTGWKELQNNIFICKKTGMKMQIVELVEFI